MEEMIVPYSRILHCGKPQGQINNYRFYENKKTPVVDIFACHNKRIIKFKFRVNEPPNRVNCFHPDFASQINKDSTVGIIFQPYLQDPRNLIIRVNAAGAYFISFGQWYWNRADCTFENIEFIEISNRHKKFLHTNSQYWEIRVNIDISALYRFINLTSWKYSPGTIMYCNFIKVRKEPEEDSHFGMWNDVKRKTFDCYKSNKLGKIILE